MAPEPGQPVAGQLGNADLLAGAAALAELGQSAGSGDDPIWLLDMCCDFEHLSRLQCQFQPSARPALCTVN